MARDGGLAMEIHDVANVIPDIEIGKTAVGTSFTKLELRNGQCIYVDYDITITIKTSDESGGICVYLEV